MGLAFATQKLTLKKDNTNKMNLNMRQKLIWFRSSNHDSR